MPGLVSASAGAAPCAPPLSEGPASAPECWPPLHLRLLMLRQAAATAQAERSASAGFRRRAIELSREITLPAVRRTSAGTNLVSELRNHRWVRPLDPLLGRG